MQIYTIPGLGFDSRIFDNIRIEDHSIQHLEWMEPKHQEPLPSYACRLVESIPFAKEQVVLIGHSFGGIVAQEIARHFPVEKVVLISSLRTGQENPLHFRILAPVGLDRLLSRQFTLSSFGFWAKRHGYRSEADQLLFRDMVARQTNIYLKWAIKELSRWRGLALKDQHRVLQIHGNLDRTFPIKKIERPDYLITDAGHFMVYQHQNKINPILNRIISGL